MNEKFIKPTPALFSEWILFRLNDNQSVNNVWYEYNCKNAKIEYFQNIVSQLIHKHEIFRYSFYNHNTKLKIKIDSSQNIPINIQDIDYFGQENWKERAFAKVKQAFNKQFDLEAVPLFRTFLVRTGENEFKFIFIIPHLLVDTHTLNMFYYETDTIYNNLIKGNITFKIPTDGIQFSSFINEQNNSDLNTSHPAYQFWLHHLKGEINDIYLGNKINHNEIIQLKKNYAENIAKLVNINNLEPGYSMVFLLHEYKSYNYSSYLQIMRRDILEKLEALAKCSNSTIFSIIATCYYLTIYKLTSKFNAIISYTLSTRNSTEKQKASGCFLNSLLIKQSINENTPLIDFIKSTHDLINQMKTNCICSIAKVWKELGLTEYINLPLNINYFINTNRIISEAANKLEGLHNLPRTKFVFDIDIKAIQGADGILFYYNYKQELFSEDRVEEIAKTMNNIVTQITSSPYMPVSFLISNRYDVI